jgi:hypothetical protein
VSAATAASPELLDRIARNAAAVLAASNAVAFGERLAERRTGPTLLDLGCALTCFRVLHQGFW